MTDINKMIALYESLKIKYSIEVRQQLVNLDIGDVAFVFTMDGTYQNLRTGKSQLKLERFRNR